MSSPLTHTLALPVCWITVARADSVPGALPDGFVDVQQAAPSIRLDLRYYTDHNFVGTRIDGYQASRAILTRPAAEALGRIQHELASFGLGLKLFDAYRPQQAAEHFMRWARDVNDTRMKAEFYPDVAKSALFKEGYIAEKSSHSRGSTVDVTLAPLHAANPAAELDLGTPFDWFGPESWPDSPAVTPAQRAHRLLLRLVMEKHGFQPYAQEWWHFTLAHEPFPDTYFDFPVR
ncbi:MAG: M15 family metallopeptidase [Candidatus Competibacteraceae bacterium]|nr:M15 family metallopeptidase [Candidatus Competibacteraceae bacterium]